MLFRNFCAPNPGRGHRSYHWQTWGDLRRGCPCLLGKRPHLRLLRNLTEGILGRRWFLLGWIFRGWLGDWVTSGVILPLYRFLGLGCISVHEILWLYLVVLGEDNSCGIELLKTFSKDIEYVSNFLDYGREIQSGILNCRRILAQFEVSWIVVVHTKTFCRCDITVSVDRKFLIPQTCWWGDILNAIATFEVRWCGWLGGNFHVLGEFWIRMIHNGISWRRGLAPPTLKVVG